MAEIQDRRSPVRRVLVMLDADDYKHFESLAQAEETSVDTYLTNMLHEQARRERRNGSWRREMVTKG